jgi:glutamate/aspartate transport system ATP-binding protein
MIKLQGVGKSYGAIRVLKDCTVAFAKGEVAVICGPSGSGKSTLIKCINGLEAIEVGRIEVLGKLVNRDSRNLRDIRRRVGMVFQSFELYPHLKIIDNITLAPIKVLRKRVDEAEANAIRLLERVGLRQHALKYPSQLSGGQQQRVAIARSLAMAPEIMLFDEPTSALDPEMINEVLDVMTDLAGEGVTMLVVTHEMGFARRVAHRVIFMSDGEILEDLPTSEFFESPRTERSKRFLSKILRH